MDNLHDERLKQPPEPLFAQREVFCVLITVGASALARPFCGLRSLVKRESKRGTRTEKGAKDKAPFSRKQTQKPAVY
jgi:hypothetical protein